MLHDDCTKKRRCVKKCPAADSDAGRGSEVLALRCVNVAAGLRRFDERQGQEEPGIVIITYYDYGDYEPTLIWHTVPPFGGTLSPSVHNIGAYYTYAAWALA